MEQNTRRHPPGSYLTFLLAIFGGLVLIDFLLYPTPWGQIASGFGSLEQLLRPEIYGAKIMTIEIWAGLLIGFSVIHMVVSNELKMLIVILIGILWIACVVIISSIYGTSLSSSLYSLRRIIPYMGMVVVGYKIRRKHIHRLMHLISLTGVLLLLITIVSTLLLSSQVMIPSSFNPIEGGRSVMNSTIGHMAPPLVFFGSLGASLYLGIGKKNGFVRLCIVSMLLLTNTVVLISGYLFWPIWSFLMVIYYLLIKKGYRASYLVVIPIMIYIAMAFSMGYLYTIDGYIQVRHNVDAYLATVIDAVFQRSDLFISSLYSLAEEPFFIKPLGNEVTYRGINYLTGSIFSSEVINPHNDYIYVLQVFGVLAGIYLIAKFMESIRVMQRAIMNWTGESASGRYVTSILAFISSGAVVATFGTVFYGRIGYVFFLLLGMGVGMAKK